MNHNPPRRDSTSYLSFGHFVAGILVSPQISLAVEQLKVETMPVGSVRNTTFYGSGP